MLPRRSLQHRLSIAIAALGIHACSAPSPDLGVSAGSVGGSGGTGSATATGSGGAAGGPSDGGPSGECSPTEKTCSGNEWCAYQPAGSCGAADATGTCMEKPSDGCPIDCPGVCGCNGTFYCNGCIAAADGWDVAAGLDCMSKDGGDNAIYSAWNLFTHVPRFVIYKADPVRDVCVRLTVSAPGGPSPVTIQVQLGGAIEAAEITDHASDCSPPSGFPAPPVGASAQAMSATGTLVINGSFPCDVSLHATLFFAPGAPWVPSSEPLDVDMLSVDGGCN